MADGRLIFDTKIDNTGFQKGMGKLKSIATGSMSAVNIAIKAAAGAVGAMGLASIKTGAQFDTSMSRVKALSGATDKEFQLLRDTAMKLGRDTVFSASEAAEGMGYLAMAGYKTNEIVAAMPGLLDMAAAGQTDLATTADITSNILSAFGIEAAKTGDVADVLTKTFTSSNTSLESLGETMKYVGPVAKSAGWSLEETATAAGILGDAGIQGSQAGTALRQMLLRLIDPPKEAAEALDQLGVSAIDNATGKIKPLEQIIREIDEATKDWDDAQRAAIVSQIAGTSSSAAMLALLDAGADTIADFQGELEKVAESTESFAKEVAEIQLDNLEGQLRLLGSVMETLGIKIYDELKAPLQEVAKDAGIAVGRLVDAFDESGFMGLADEVGSVLTDALQKAASFAPKMLDMGKRIILSFLDGIRSNMGEISTSMASMLQGVIESFVEIYPAFIATGIELIANILQGLVEGMPQIIESVQTGASMLVEAIVENLPLMLEAGIQIIVMLAQGIAEMMPELITQFIDLVIMLADVIIENLPIMIEAGLQIMLAIAQGLIENLPTLIEHVPRIINAFFDAFIENLPQIIMAGMQLIWMLIVGIIQSIPTLIANIPAIVRAIVNVITMYNWAQLGKSIMTWLRDGIAKMPGKIAEAAKHIAKAAWDAIKNKFAQAPGLGSGFIKWLINGIMSMLGNLASSAGSLAKAAWNAILGIFRNAPSLGRNFINWLRSGISSMTGNLGATARKISIAAMRAVKNVFKGMPGIGKQFVKGLWSGIASLTGWIGRQIAGFAKGLVKKFKDFFKIKSPSRLMRDEIGKNLALGIGVGLEDETPALNRTIDREMSGLAKQMKATVDLETQKTGHRVAGTSTYTAKEIIKEEKASEETPVSGDLYTIIEVEGKEMMRIMTPYMSEELYRLIRRGY